MGPAVPSEEILGVALLVSDGEVGFRNSNRLFVTLAQTVAYGIGGKAVTHTALEGGNFRLRSGKLRLMTGGFDSLTTTILGGSHYLRQQTVALQLFFNVTEAGLTTIADLVHKETKFRTNNMSLRL
uniref:(California timema) hypothetical protein n=1 Tax=Timema californicum TaxID=61474 RepID=A0A7R9P8L9_TIMCA|nr:unnamed protein product [Timema californicum]